MNRHRLLAAVLCMTLWSVGFSGAPSHSAEELRAQPPHDFVGAAAPIPAETVDPPLVVEGSNSCEIVSCGMGIKETCQIACPAEKTPKCSCDCTRNIGPMCMEYKAHCRCE